MTLEQLADSLPGYAKDLKLNLSSVLRQPELTPGQLWGTAVACALAARNPALLDALTDAALKHIGGSTIEGARIAASIMAMNNVWYRFSHLSANERFASMPARLRMNGLRSHGCDAAEFELWCIAVSAINGCNRCVVAHENVLKEKGVGDEQIAAAIRIAAVVQAVATILSTAPIAIPSPAPALA